MTTLLWFRNDLRLSDNSALTAACQASDDVIPVFIFDESPKRSYGAAQRWWLYHSLKSLDASLRKKRVNILFCKGKAEQKLQEIIKKYKVNNLYFNRSFEPDLNQRDQSITKRFSKLGVEVKQFSDYLLIDPDKIKNKSGEYFKVYTPYSRAIFSSVEARKPLPIPKISQKTKVITEEIEAWGLLPTKPDWSVNFEWQPGETHAQNTLVNFLESDLKSYKDDRDRPDFSGTSRLSPYLHFGEISINHVWYAVLQEKYRNPSIEASAEVYLKQLVWREFSYYLLHYFPLLPYKNYRSAFDRFSWESNQACLAAWKSGETGFPIVDAGMRELWQSGYMHNRVRMIVASFLTKDLLIDWREGESWFWDTLVDADLANNAAGWQWVAGSGADAAPYFRIFNPFLQSKKFDPDGVYIRRWLPELKDMPNKYIHNPAESPIDVVGYPKPIIDHGVARKKALALYKGIK